MAKGYADETRRLLERLAERRVVDVALESHDKAQAELARAAGRRGAHAVSAGLRVAAGQSTVAAQVTGDLDAALRDVQTEALRAIQRMFGRLQPGATPLDDPRVFERVVGARAREVARGTRAVLASWAGEAQGEVDAAVRAARSAGTAESARAVLNVAEGAADAARWKVERIARTEAAYAFNAVQHEAVRELARAYPDIMQRWTELVDDATGRPLDNRVAVDSIAMHGQLAPPGGLFTMPAHPGVSAKLVGKTWSFPPNRPNDRAVVAPWRAAWGVPGWVLRGGARVALRG